MNNEKIKLRKQSHLQSHPKNKILQNKFNKSSATTFTMKYSEKYKILLKEMKKNLSKWKDIPYLLVEDI